MNTSSQKTIIWIGGYALLFRIWGYGFIVWSLNLSLHYLWFEALLSLLRDLMLYFHCLGYEVMILIKYIDYNNILHVDIISIPRGSHDIEVRHSLSAVGSDLYAWYNVFTMENNLFVENLGTCCLPTKHQKATPNKLLLI
jgi:hypothetical protein